MSFLKIFFLPCGDHYVQLRDLDNSSNTHYDFSTKLMFITARSSTTITQRFHKFKYTVVSKLDDKQLFILSLTALQVERKR